MSNFRFQVRTSAGQVSSGVIEAENLLQATGALRERGGAILNILPVETRPRNLLETLRKVNFQRGPNLKDIQNFTSELAVMIKAGISIRNAIDGISEQVENPKFKKVILQIKLDVESGLPFSEALARHRKVFTPLYINMVRASELSGNFGHMLERITAYLSQQLETRRMVRGAMIYPIIIAVMAVVTTVFLLTFVLPRFTMLFAGKDKLLPKPTVMLMGLSAFMQSYWHVLLGVLVVAVVGFVQLLRTRTGRQYWDIFKLRVPIFKRMFRALYITRGMQTMGELIGAGVPMLETLKITADVSGNFAYRRMWQSVHDSVKQGNKIVEPLSRQRLLPRNVVQMVAAGEESGKLGAVLQDVSEYYAKELHSTIKAVTAMIEPLMIVIMGFVVGFIAMSVVLPIFKLSSLVKQ